MHLSNVAGFLPLGTATASHLTSSAHTWASLTPSRPPRVRQSFLLIQPRSWPQICSPVCLPSRPVSPRNPVCVSPQCVSPPVGLPSVGPPPPVCPLPRLCLPAVCLPRTTKQPVLQQCHREPCAAHLSSVCSAHSRPMAPLPTGQCPSPRGARALQGLLAGPTLQPSLCLCARNRPRPLSPVDVPLLLSLDWALPAARKRRSP